MHRPKIFGHKSLVVSLNDNTMEIWMSPFILLSVFRELRTSGGGQEETSPQEATF